MHLYRAYRYACIYSKNSVITVDTAAVRIAGWLLCRRIGLGVESSRRSVHGSFVHGRLQLLLQGPIQSHSPEVLLCGLYRACQARNCDLQLTAGLYLCRVRTLTIGGRWGLDAKRQLVQRHSPGREYFWAWLNFALTVPSSEATV